MNCPKCNKPNREKAVFCKWCGTNVVTKATEPLRELVGMETAQVIWCILPMRCA